MARGVKAGDSHERWDLKKRKKPASLADAKTVSIAQIIGRKADALITFGVGTNWAQTDDGPKADISALPELSGDFGGRREDRTRDLRIANAALSQLS